MKQMRSCRRPAVLAVIAVAVAACSSTNDGGSARSNSTEVRPIRTIKVIDSMIEEGETQFNANCKTCHGEEGVGRIGIAPSLTSTSFLEAASDPWLVRTITGGRQGTTMAGFGDRLEGYQIEAMVAYLRSKNETKPPLLNESPVFGDADKGAQIFRTVCATCHGRRGAGYQESTSGSGIGRRGFLSTVSVGYLRYIIKNGKSGTPMKPFTDQVVTNVTGLGDDQVEDVIAHLKKSAW